MTPIRSGSTPDGAAPGAAVLFFHGGGYIFGRIDLLDGPLARYVSASGVPMLSVEYLLAPEHPFPTPIEDAYTAPQPRIGLGPFPGKVAGALGVDPARTSLDYVGLNHLGWLCG
ncbi:alpha/beta hydrolase fold domain-containing protein, partial [Streptomyces canus]|uniref:alpha/beta hydrolase n=1 Tax=Streptomyces canus TaxID=58343 RepID=UPI00339FBF7C